MNTIRYLSLFCFFYLSFNPTNKIGFAADANDGLRAELNPTSKIAFRLYTRNNPTEFQEIVLNDPNSISISNYNSKLPTKIFAPGWDNTGVIAEPTRDEYLKREDCNVIVIYWIELQAGLGNGILFSVKTTQKASEYTGAFINFLIENGTPISSLHLIGHSAGAHLVGGAAPRVIYGRIPRITGLDPGNAGWSLDEPSTCLDPSDAEFVDVIHTNGGGLLAFDEPLGHVDFYPNGGQKQPGCETPETTCCSHCRAVELFAESINNPLGFLSRRCGSYESYQSGACDGNELELMGDSVSLEARGLFYTVTNGQAPFAQG